MAKVSIIDDDFAIEPLIDWLLFAGHKVDRYASAEQALLAIDLIAVSDLVLLDVMMARPETMCETLSLGGRRTGLVLAKEIRAKNSDVPLVIFSGTQDQFVHDWCKQATNVVVISKLLGLSLKEITERLESLVGGKSVGRRGQAFIVHGHDEVVKLQLKNYLQNTLNLPEPIILHEQASIGRTVIEKFEAYAREADIAFVILTPDDKVASVGGSNDEKRRARQNVIFELGYFMGMLRRSSGRVFLLHKGPLELPSDLYGIVYIDVSNGIESAGEALCTEIKHVIG